MRAKFANFSAHVNFHYQCACRVDVSAARLAHACTACAAHAYVTVTRDRCTAEGVEKWTLCTNGNGTPWRQSHSKHYRATKQNTEAKRLDVPKARQHFCRDGPATEKHPARPQRAFCSRQCVRQVQAAVSSTVVVFEAGREKVPPTRAQAMFELFVVVGTCAGFYAVGRSHALSPVTEFQ